MAFDPVDGRIRQLMREMAELERQHKEKIKRINRRFMLMNLLLAIVVLFSLVGCAPFWGNVVDNWEGPCPRRCHACPE